MLLAPTSVVKGISYHIDMEVFKNSFLNVDNKYKVCMLKKFREISNPVSSSLVDPIEKVSTWG